MPEEDGHNHAVDEHGRGPEGAALEEAAGGFSRARRRPVWATPRASRVTLGGRLLLISLGAHGYHADGIGAEGDEGDERGEAGGGPEEGAAGCADAAGLPGVAELVDGEPDEEVVEPSENLPAGAEGEQVGEGGGGGEGCEGGEAVTLPGAVGEGCEEDHEDVDDEEPGGQEGELGGVFENEGRGVESIGPGVECSRQEGPDQEPGGEDGEDGQDQALEAAGEPGGVVFAAALGGLPAKGVDVAADEEEDGHDLEEPG